MNRDVTINSFEGGMDLDSDNKIIQANKTREAYNTDIRKSGNVSVITDLKGESVVSVLEDTSVYEVFTLASDSAQLLVQPTKSTLNTIVFFYIRKSGNSHQFVVKFLRESNGGNCACIIEDITSDQYNFLKDSTIDFVKIGKFGYDVFYFVDNLRQPRKLECILYRTNDTVLTITESSPVITDPEPNNKIVNLNINPSGEILDGFRAYIYAYKTGKSFSDSTANPLTETIKFVDFSEGDVSSKFVFFRIYEEDYANWTFEIVYHREGENVFSNFVIGEPKLVNVSVGVFPNVYLIMQDSPIGPSSTQIPSWDFLYDGSVLTVYSNDPIINIGSTLLYASAIESSGSLLPTGFYQDISSENSNKYIQVENGLVIDYDVNNGDLIPIFDPPTISNDVKLAATTFTEGPINRLSTASYELALNVSSGGENYIFDGIQLRGVKDVIQPKSFIVERSEDLSPVIIYLSETVNIELFADGFLDGRPGGPVEIDLRVELSRPISQNINISGTVSVNLQLGGTLNPLVSVFVEAGQTSAIGTETVEIGNDENVLSVTNPCISNTIYSGPETINLVNQC